jgi:hypothetical protein
MAILTLLMVRGGFVVGERKRSQQRFVSASLKRLRWLELLAARDFDPLLGFGAQE